MKALIVGSDHPAALERTYSKYLNEAGIAAEIFPAQQLFLQYYRKGLLNKLVFRAGLSNIYRSINRTLKGKITAFNPDFIWVFKGMEVLPSTIRWIKKEKIKVINFNPDNPYVFSGRGSGNANVTRSRSLFDHYFTYDHEVLDIFRNDQIASSLLPFGYDFDAELLGRFHQQLPEINKACFIGMPDKYRVAFIQQLIDAQIPLDLYGNNWSKYIDPSKAGIFPAQYGDDFLKVLCNYRVQLNYMRPHNLQSHNMRTFEIAGAGSIQVAPRTKDHEMFFRENTEIFLFDDLNECAQKVKTLLSLSVDAAEQLRANVRWRCNQEKYTYKDRAEEVIAVLKTLE